MVTDIRIDRLPACLPACLREWVEWMLSMHVVFYEYLFMDKYIHDSR